jgi:hypothetical protein
VDSGHRGSRGRARADPTRVTVLASLVCPEAGGSRPAYVDVSIPVRTGFRTDEKPLRVDSKGLSWGDESVDFDLVTSIAYWWVNMGGPLGVDYFLDLYTGERRTRVSFTGQRGRFHRDIFDRAIAAVRNHVEWRLVVDIIRRLDRGEEVAVGNLRASRAGLAVRPRRFGLKQAQWSAVLEIRPWYPPSLPGGLKIFAANSRGRKRKLGVSLFETPNTVLLPTLVRACADRYSASTG